jgi:dihydrofolate reductase
MTRVVLVAAMAHNRVIGHEGGMPWHLPADLKHFKAVTLGHPVIMGRRTFESIGRPLPGRTNIVISRGRPDLPEGVALAGSFEEALQGVASETAMVIGGGEIYRQALPHADRLELTLIDADISGDTQFPEWRPAEWRLTAMTSHPPDERNTHALVFCSFERRN